MQAQFKILLENIRLTEGQESDARTKYNGVCEVLHDAYYPDTSYNGGTKLLFGSYGKHTHIRPPRDVDVLFKMPPSEFDRFEDLSGNRQSQLLQEVRSVLMDTYTTTEEIRAFGKVVVIGFAEGTHTIELLPGWELTDGRFRIPNTENGGSWEVFDPVSEIGHISESNVRTGKTLDIIRICKKWTEFCNVPLKSFIVELLVVQFLNVLDEPSLDRSYAEHVAAWLQFLVGIAGSTIFSPNGSAIALGDEWKSKAESAMQRAMKAREFEGRNELGNASLEWKKLFGDDFPKASDDADVDIEAIVATYQIRYPSSAEEYLDKKYNIPFRINPAYAVQVDTQVEQRGFRRDWLSTYIRKRFALNKRKKLDFAIRSNNVPAPFNVYWKVRNFGDEAHQANGLRGEISEDRGFHNKRESTLYHGQHYVECYIVKNGACVAVGRILVPIGNEYE